MQEYEVKRGMTKDLPDRIAAGFPDIFQIEPKVEDGTVFVDTETNKDVLAMPDEEADVIILDTNKRFRQYLDLVTGFTTKERVKRAKKAAEKGE